MKGLSCPDWPLLAHIAFAQQTLGLYVARLALLPLMVLVAAIAEARRRIFARWSSP